MIKIYSYSLCGTCKKALKWLESNHIQYDLIDISKITPTKETIIEAIDQLGNRKYLFNTSGKSYRSLGAERVKSMSDEEAIESLLSDGKLIKRPFVVDSKGSILVGFNEVIWRDFFLS